MYMCLTTAFTLAAHNIRAKIAASAFVSRNHAIFYVLYIEIGVIGIKTGMVEQDDIIHRGRESINGHI